MLREKNLFIILTIIILLTLAVLSWMLVNSSLFDPELSPGAKKVFNEYKLEEANLNSNDRFRLKLSMR
ncbi:hypothetical protein [Acetohalobium arabaticum]|uniref:Uncharacterized protein n=1 Tax=Acetohalobium arabaticum (strain ATCC 49924 / DSM 5501 / Z-7288) TaxID=574087 RepID=D9QRR8_ACEAZ|nr:hypothetical protein [Acetohalobium arabaticum]ADL13209.1 hypothetical protein Acear_1704 [Acetohalobium arabaticum DSM 5501]